MFACDSLIVPRHSLVKYSIPEVVDVLSRNFELAKKQTSKTAKIEEPSHKTTGRLEDDTRDDTDIIYISKPGEVEELEQYTGRDYAHLLRRPVDPNASRTFEEVVHILNRVFPPIYSIRRDKEERIMCRETISWEPSNRLEIKRLNRELDVLLQNRQARARGLCPVRRELYNQLMDEMIRQITINCVERGLLLVRVRDEIRMTINCFKSLLQAGVCMGSVLSTKVEKDTCMLNGDIRRLEEELVQLRSAKDYWTRRLQTLEDAMQKDLYVLMKKNEEEKAELKQRGELLEAQLVAINSFMSMKRD